MISESGDLLKAMGLTHWVINLVMSPSRAEGFSARLVTFFHSARNEKSGENEPKFRFWFFDEMF